MRTHDLSVVFILFLSKEGTPVTNVVLSENMACGGLFDSDVYMHTSLLISWFVVSGIFRVTCSGPAPQFRDRREWRTNAFHREFQPRRVERTSKPARQIGRASCRERGK